MGHLLVVVDRRILPDTFPVVVDSTVLVMMLEAFDLDQAEACLVLHTVRNHSYQHLVVGGTLAVRGVPPVIVGVLEIGPAVGLEAYLAGLEAFLVGLEACLDLVPCPVRAGLGTFLESWGWVVCQVGRWQGSERVSAVDQIVMGEQVVGVHQGSLRPAGHNLVAAPDNLWVAEVAGYSLVDRGVAVG